jgi:hypothetical protein
MGLTTENRRLFVGDQPLAVENKPCINFTSTFVLTSVIMRSIAITAVCSATLRYVGHIMFVALVNYGLRSQ